MENSHRKVSIGQHWYAKVSISKPRGPGGGPGESDGPGVSPENKNPDTENPCRDQFFLFTMSKSDIDKKNENRTK
jgi:hypothetical protein